MSNETNEQMTPEQLEEFKKMRQENTDQIKEDMPHLQAEVDYWDTMAKIEEAKARYALAIRKQAEIRFGGGQAPKQEPKEFAHPAPNEKPFGEETAEKKPSGKKKRSLQKS